MKPRTAALYLQGLVQGISFTTVPAASNFLTSPSGFGFSASQYGALYLPLIFGAIIASFFGGMFGKKVGIKPVFAFGALINILSMIVLACCQMAMSTPLAYPLFLLGMLCIGSGFGATLATLNTYTFAFFPHRGQQALTALHASLGIGTALGPLLFNLFQRYGKWWLDPLFIAAAYLVLLFLSLAHFPKRVELDSHKTSQKRMGKYALIFFTCFLAIAFFYGICETTFGNWGTIFLHTTKGLSQEAANVALSLFWLVITLGRLAVFFLSFVVRPALLFRLLAPLLFVSLFAVQTMKSDLSAYLTFALAGLGCSSFLPLTVGLAQKNFLAKAQMVSGVIMAIYMAGYGVASEGVALLQKLTEIPFATLFEWLFVPVILLGLLTIFVTRRSKKDYI